jgi:F-type H+-transporting ATPase subunit delta
VESNKVVKEIVARRYAKALFQAIQPGPSDAGARAEVGAIHELSLLSLTLKVLVAVTQAFKEQDYFRHAMLNPGFDREAKVQALKVLLERMQASGPVVRFVEYLVRKNRFRYLGQITQAFAALVDEFQGIIKVPISIAKELSLEEQETVRRGLESIIGRKVQVQWSVNPSLIGGMMIRVGEAVVDGTVLGQLQAIRRKLVEA